MTNREALISALNDEFSVTEDYNRNDEVIANALSCPYPFGDKRNCIYKDENVDCLECVKAWLDAETDRK